MDVSWGKLKAKELNTIVWNLKNDGFKIRNLNLSYNELDFNEKSPHYEDSMRFMINIDKFIPRARFLNHINLSGMNFGQV